MRIFKSPSLFLAFFALAVGLKANPTVAELSVNSTPSSVTFSASAYDDYGALNSIDFYVMGPGESDWIFVGSSQTDSYGYSGRAEFSWTPPPQYGTWSVIAVPHDLWDAYWDGAASTTFEFVAPLPATCDSITTSANPVYGDSYEAYANNVQNATRVLFPTWTDANGQDELIWYEGVYDAANNRWKCTVNLGEHNCEGGSYTTHVYLLGTNGQWSFAGGMSTDVVIQVSAMRDVAILSVGTVYAPISYTNAVPLYRLFDQNGGSGDHLYTTDYNEAVNATNHGFVIEGIIGYVQNQQAYGTVPLYRYYFGGKHFYTTNYNELGEWHKEGIACYVYTGGSSPYLVPLKRYYNGSVHFYTTDPAHELMTGTTRHYESVYRWDSDTRQWGWFYDFVGYEDGMQFEGVQCYILK